MRRQVLSLLLQIVMLSMWAGELGWAAPATALTLAGSTQMPFTLGNGAFAVWSGGMFLAVQGRFSSSPILRIFDRNGTQVSQFTFSIPGASLINLYGASVASGSDGSLAIVGTAYTNDSRSGMFIAWVSPDRQTQTIIRSSPFFPRAVTVASDGTIWVAGDQLPQPTTPDYSQRLIRRYDKTGNLLGSFIPWSTLGTDPYHVPPTVGSVLLSLIDRVAWYSPRSNKYIEFSLAGAVINQFNAAPHAQGESISVALCGDGSLFASTRIPGAGQQTNWGVYALNRQLAKAC